MSANLLEVWAAWRPVERPYILPGDNEAIDLLRAKGRIRPTYNSWQEYQELLKSGLIRDRPPYDQLDLSLLPHPFCGNLETAKIIALTLNPGLSHLDVFAEFETRHQDALRRCLRGDHQSEKPFLYLDPQFAWHDAYSYWRSKLKGILSDSERSFDANDNSPFDRHFATLELCPYHSTAFKGFGRVINDLHSVRLAREYVRDHLLKRADDDDCVIVVVRRKHVWKLPETDNVIIGESGRARGGWFSEPMKERIRWILAQS